MIQALPPFTTQETTMQKRDHEDQGKHLGHDEKPDPDFETLDAPAPLDPDSGGGGHTDPDKPHK